MRLIIIAIILCLIGAGCYGLAQVNWSESQSCPKGQTLTATSWVPIMVGKVIVITPIYGCEASQ